MAAAAVAVTKSHRPVITTIQDHTPEREPEPKSQLAFSVERLRPRLVRMVD